MVESIKPNPKKQKKKPAAETEQIEELMNDPSKIEEKDMVAQISFERKMA